MAQQPQNSIAPNVFELTGRPGVKRDSTNFDSDYWQDAQWTRFRLGRPRKMGGYKALSDQLLGPIRAVYVDSRSTGNTAHTFSPSGIEQVSFNNDGIVSNVVDRTPSGFVPNDNYTWQTASMFQSGGGGSPLLIASATPDLANIASDVAGPIYSGDVTGTSALTAVSDGSPITVSGGICMLQPFLFVYGSNGLIRNSNPNDISSASGWTTGGANYASTANVAGTKIVKGLPMRGGGSSPAGLFWALDSLIRVTFVGGTQLWRYDTLSDDTSVLSKSGIVEHDNTYYWMGVDRFWYFNGIAQELPNQLNLDWVFDNLNFAQRQKVWALKVPRYGEIWWFFPTGSNTECDTAVIFNVREQTWYDTRLQRTGGYPARVFASPLAAGELVSTTKIAYSSTGGAFTVGETVQGATSSATGQVARVTGSQLNLVNVAGTFQSGENIADITHGGIDTGTVSAAPSTQQLTTLWQHEIGHDKVTRQQIQAIESYVVSNNMQWMTGGPIAGTGNGVNAQMRLLKIEPDFDMAGDMTVQVVGVSYAQSQQTNSQLYSFSGETTYIDMREQKRELALKFTSNVAGGYYKMGRVLLTTEIGDERG